MVNIVTISFYKLRDDLKLLSVIINIITEVVNKL